MESKNLIARPWKDYELLDSGDNRKLERYGSHIVIRPETQAVWQAARPKDWTRSEAEFKWSEGKGFWTKRNLPESWPISYGDVRFTIKLTNFKHTGVFPEQASNWDWIKTRVEAIANPEVLNLFGYTGVASLVAAKAGAHVTHVDASKQSNAWAKDNAKLSKIPEQAIRFITDDALKFCERELRRGVVYDGIILDPPAFGRGAKGEVWHIEEDLPKILSVLKKLLSEKPGAFFLLNGYAAGYSPLSFLQAVQGFFPKKEMEFGELRIEENISHRFIPSGIYVRF